MDRDLTLVQHFEMGNQISERNSYTKKVFHEETDEPQKILMGMDRHENPQVNSKNFS